MRLHNLFLIFLFSLTQFSLKAQTTNQQVFQLLSKAQPINNSPSIAGKFLLLDFWATWCGPCIAAFPELEKLQEKYKDSLTVISISDEHPAIVQKFLSKRNQPTISFLCDTTAAIFKLFNVRPRPTYILLNPNGEFLWTGHLDMLLPQLSKIMQENKPYPFLTKANTSLNSDIKTTPPLFALQFNISVPGTAFSGNVNIKDYQKAYAKMRNTPFPEVLSYFSDIPEREIVNNRPDLDSLSLDLTLECNQTSRTACSVREQVMKSLQYSFNFHAEIVPEKVQGYELSLQPAFLNKYKEETEGGGFVKREKDSLFIWRLTPEWLAEIIGKKTNAHIQAKPGLTQDKFTFAVPYQGDKQALFGELEKLGIVLKRKTLTVDKLIVK